MSKPQARPVTTQELWMEAIYDELRAIRQHLAPEDTMGLTVELREPASETCGQCGRTFAKKAGLARHVQASH